MITAAEASLQRSTWCPLSNGAATTGSGDRVVRQLSLDAVCSKALCRPDESAIVRVGATRCKDHPGQICDTPVCGSGRFTAEPVQGWAGVSFRPPKRLSRLA